MGVEHPPINSFKKSFSIFVQIAVASSLKEWQALKASASSFLHTTIIAPCVGAGNIQSKSIAFAGRRFILSKPAAAKMAPSQLLSFNLRKRVFTLPRKFSITEFG